jgi:hypothetical protein
MFPPSVNTIRDALAEVPGALRLEPEAEDSGVGGGPGVPTWISNPDTNGGMTESFSPQNDDDEGGAVDEPGIVFEVPPEITDAELREALGEKRIGELQQLHQVRGVDALGWYLTFHQLHSQHGIHIPLEGAAWLALNFLKTLELPLGRKLELAFHAILRHELVHFEADCMIANWELTAGVEVYWSSRKHRNTNGYIELEEALANAYMLRGFKHPTRLLKNAPGAYGALKEFCSRQSVGYKDGPVYTESRTRYLSGCRELSRPYREAAQADWPVPSALDSVMVYPSPTKIDWTRCPIMIYDRADIFRGLGIRPSYFEMVTGIEETDKFRHEFRKLDRSIQKRWYTSKFALERSTSLKSLGFKQWDKIGPNWYSVRIGSNFRAHLRYERDGSRWFAEAIGDHKKMGHG